MFLWPLLIILCDGFYYQNQFRKNADIKVTNSLIKLFLYTFQHPKKSCSDSSQGVVPTSKTAPTTASISKTTSNSAPISNAAPTTASTSKSVTSLSVAPTSGVAVSEASSIYAHREKVVSKTVTDSNKKTVTTISNTGNGEVTIFNDNLGCHAKMASITATPCSPPLKTRLSSPSAEEKEVNIQVQS